MKELLTSAETVMRRVPLVRDPNAIPPITDPMGKNWNQPPTSAILIDDINAVMDQVTFNWLANYSATMPSGVYPGKMWKRHDGLHDPRCKPEDRKWLLMWYGYDDDPKQCSINHRRILIVKPESET